MVAYMHSYYFENTDFRILGVLQNTDAVEVRTFEDSRRQENIFVDSLEAFCMGSFSSFLQSQHLVPFVFRLQLLSPTANKQLIGVASHNYQRLLAGSRTRM